MKHTPILDFGAGLHARHTLRLRAVGATHVTAHDFGRNFVEGLHDSRALRVDYAYVVASNVLNVHCTYRALNHTLCQIAAATAPLGQAIVNFPQSPRRVLTDLGRKATPNDLEKWLWSFYAEVTPIAGDRHSPVYLCVGPVLRSNHLATLASATFTPEELAAATVRPTGAVGRDPIVYRCLATALNLVLS